MIGKDVVRDERTVSVENASYRWGYMVLAYGILASVAYRGLVHEQANWELLAVVVVSGVVTTFWQGRRKVLSRRSVALVLAAVALAALLAAAIGLIR